ncbi:helix-turn-helix transcriptional regulator [Acidisoma cellulosilytica]|uniref:Helix-turn-helix transcriptional regulator n=1 Tax=Acidisoma cellulosilyticum TaxID=2802395 RepID=A0A963Z5Y4_9PROT|nr:helix-turn-helix transcriptional regulator [Acidisoma cellulosilyticum]
MAICSRVGSRVAAEAGVGKQTIYRHFQSKEALVEAMCRPRWSTRRRVLCPSASGCGNCCWRLPTA